jgi:HlyD family secretion protein
MKKTILALSLLVVAALVWAYTSQGRGTEAVNYRLVTVERGDLEAVVSSTGTLDAVTTVQVGTQVSGIIDEILVDYNDPVTAGQVIARIDKTLLANNVAASEAQLERNQAELRHAQREFARIDALRAEMLVSESEHNQAQYTLEAARASVKSANADLERARRNLDFATITSPIDGTVIDRSVDVGQTVQSSFSAPELFLIAGDLKEMQILVAVDESDIGQIAEGQTARFTVQAYPDDSFSGTVRQVRLQSASTENVVNYTAVVDVANPDGRLLPGMTATVDFLVETASDVLYVPNAALRYKPDQEAIGRMNSGQMPADRGALWTVDENGDLALIPVRTGLSDGTSTQISGPMLAEGQQVIAGISRSSGSSGNSNPFQQQQQGGRRPGPPSPGGF